MPSSYAGEGGVLHYSCCHIIFYFYNLIRREISGDRINTSQQESTSVPMLRGRLRQASLIRTTNRAKSHTSKDTKEG